MSTTLRHRQELQRLAPVFDGLAGLRWCLIKWTDDGREHGDLDILIDATDATLARLDTQLRGHGYTYDPDPDRYRRKYVHDRLGTEVDLHTAAAWVGIRYLPADWILSTAERERVGAVAVPRPSPEADLCIWAAHDMRSNAITAADVAYCRGLLERADVYACRAIAREHHWGHQFDAFVDALGRVEPADCPFHFGFAESLGLKARKVLAEAVAGRPGRAADELVQLVKFDVVRSVRRT